MRRGDSTGGGACSGDVERLPFLCTAMGIEDWLETVCPLGKHLLQLEVFATKKLRCILHGRNQGRPNSWCRRMLKAPTVESALRGTATASVW